MPSGAECCRVGAERSRVSPSGAKCRRAQPPPPGGGGAAGRSLGLPAAAGAAGTAALPSRPAIASPWRPRTRCPAAEAGGRDPASQASHRAPVRGERGKPWGRRREAPGRCRPGAGPRFGGAGGWAMRLQCEVEVISRLLPTCGLRGRGRATRALLSLGRPPGRARGGGVYLMVCTARDRSGARYKVGAPRGGVGGAGSPRPAAGAEQPPCLVGAGEHRAVLHAVRGGGQGHRAAAGARRGCLPQQGGAGRERGTPSGPRAGCSGSVRLIRALSLRLSLV